MKKIGVNYILLIVVIVMIYWVGDTFWDKYTLFPNESFWKLLVHDPEAEHPYTRYFSSLLIIVVVFVYIYLYNNFNKVRVSYEHLLSNVNDGVFIKPAKNFTADERCTEVNKAACKMLGYTRNELLQLSPQDFVAPEKLSEMQALMETIKTKGHALQETVFLKKDGSKLPVEINANVFRFRGQSYCLALVRDNSERVAAKNALREKEKQLLGATERLLNVQEEERGRMSQELHDELGQDLMFVKMEIHSIKDSLPEQFSGLRNECDYLLEHLEKTVENVRRLSHQLKPLELEEMGFDRAIFFLINDSSQLYGLEPHHLDIDEIGNLLSSEVQLHLYRIFQECLTNIGKHAQATEISVGLKRQGSQVVIRIKDNGQGFDQLKASTEIKGLGLSTLKERARLIGGQLNIVSHPGQGTEIHLAIPLDKLNWRKGVKGNETLSNHTS